MTDFANIAVSLRVRAERDAQGAARLVEFVDTLRDGPWPGLAREVQNEILDTALLKEAAQLIQLLVPHESEIRALIGEERRAG